MFVDFLSFLLTRIMFSFSMLASIVGNYSCLKVDLIFTRDRSFYFTTVFIPGIILVTSSFITFWLEWNAVPARVMIGRFGAPCAKKIKSVFECFVRVDPLCDASLATTVHRVCIFLS